MPKKFNPTVESFAEVSKNLAKIDKYLTRLTNVLQRIDWKKLPKKPRGPGDPNEEPGSKPGKWPP
jgi:hypothetical protein